MEKVEELEKMRRQLIREITQMMKKCKGFKLAEEVEMMVNDDGDWLAYFRIIKVCKGGVTGIIEEIDYSYKRELVSFKELNLEVLSKLYDAVAEHISLT